MKAFSLLTALVASASSVRAGASSPIIANYWPAYNAAKQAVSAIPWQHSDLAYFFVAVTTETGFEVPDDGSQEYLNSFVSTADAKGSKPLVSIGGWSGSLYFSKLVETEAKRTKLANDMKEFIDKYGFKGVDIDWEYPNGEGIGCNAISPSDASNFLAFLKVLRATIGTDALITAAVSTAGINGEDGKVMDSLAGFGDYLDYLNLMTYDVAGSWSTTTGPNAPLRVCNSDTGVDAAVEVYTSRGFPAEKILLGIPAYAISFTTSSSTLSKTSITSNGRDFTSLFYQKWDGVVPQGAPGDEKSTAGTDTCGNEVAGGTYSGQWLYSELISNELLSTDGSKGLNGYTRHFDACAQTPFLFNPDKKHLISYDDGQSAGRKARWARSKGLGGVMIFDSTGFTTDVYETIRSNLSCRKSSARRHRQKRARSA
ncbi:hypothetical protein JCM10207_008478 [Rhodosporidiobolus poonsookiae]